MRGREAEERNTKEEKRRMEEQNEARKKWRRDYSRQKEQVSHIHLCRPNKCKQCDFAFSCMQFEETFENT